MDDSLRSLGVMDILRLPWEGVAVDALRTLGLRECSPDELIRKLLLERLNSEGLGEVLWDPSLLLWLYVLRGECSLMV